ncbi:MAG TPA: YceI family protein [Alphaproteobacteria bacterium]|nr:YceI family protein [Alphaproteobacteria bacterium]
MKRVLSAGLLAILLVFGFNAAPSSAAGIDVPSGVYNMDPMHAYIAFSYTHFGFSHPILRFNKFQANLNFNAEDPAKSTLSVMVDPTSIDAGTDTFNEHLQSDRFFDTAKFKEITFKATSMKVTGPKTGTITGNLTIKGVTKPVTLNVTLNKAGTNPMTKGPALGFSARATLKRSDWGLGAYAPMVSDDVHLMIEAEFHAKAAK